MKFTSIVLSIWILVKYECLNVSQNEISRRERVDDKILDLQQAISKKVVVRFW